MTLSQKIREQINVFGHCSELNVPLWSCPRFIFLVMGFVIIFSILTTYEIAQRYTEPDIVIGLVSFLTIFLLTITQVIVNAFENVVHARVREKMQTKELLELRDEFVHFAVHDLAAAATAIKWGLRTVEPRIKDLSEIEKELFGDIRDRNERLIELARQILLITRIESGHLEVHLETLEPESLVAKTMTDLARTTKEKHISVKYTPPDRPLPITSDPIHLAEIFRILFINSMTHTNPEEGKISITVSEKEEGGVAITIENNGQEINKDTQKHVFEKLWRKENGEDKKIAGTSFGLYIVKSLVQALHGTISFTTAPEKTIFTIILPKEWK